MKHEITNVDGDVIATVDSADTTLVISGQELAWFDIAWIISQAGKISSYEYENGVNEPCLNLRNLEFQNCRKMRSGGQAPKPISSHKHEIRKITFGKQSDADNPSLFRLFAEYALNNDRGYFKTEPFRQIDLTGSNFSEADWTALEKVSQLQVASLILRNCWLTDQHMPFLRKLVDNEESAVCQLFLEGNNLSPEAVAELEPLLIANQEKWGTYGAQYHGHPGLHLNLPWAMVELKADGFKRKTTYRELEHMPGRFITVPVYGGVLDLSTMDRTYMHDLTVENESKDLTNYLSSSSPEEVVFDGEQATEKLQWMEMAAYDLPRNYLYNIGDKSKLTRISVTNFLPPSADQNSASSISFAGRIIQALGSFPNIKVVNLDGNDFSASVFEYRFSLNKAGLFNALVSVPGIEEITLSNTNLNNLAIVLSPEFYDAEVSEDPQCMDLSLTGSKASDSLRKIDLSRNPLTDACVPKLLEWLQDSRVVEVNVRGTNITKTGVLTIERVCALNASKLTGTAQDTSEEKPVTAKLPEKKTLDPDALRASLLKSVKVSVGFA